MNIIAKKRGTSANNKPATSGTVTLSDHTLYFNVVAKKEMKLTDKNDVVFKPYYTTFLIGIKPTSDKTHEGYAISFPGGGAVTARPKDLKKYPAGKFPLCRMPDHKDTDLKKCDWYKVDFKS